MDSLTFRLARGAEEADDFEVVVHAPVARGPWPVLAPARPSSFLCAGACFVGEQSCGDDEQMGWLIRARVETVGERELSGLMVALPRGEHIHVGQPVCETWWEGQLIGAGCSGWETTLPNGKTPGRDTDLLHWSSLPGFGEEEDGHLFMRWHERSFVKKEAGISGVVSIDGYYYLSMCRRTGHISGIYNDSTSASASQGVFQRLELKPAAPGTPLLERQERARHRSADGPLSFSAPLAER